MRALLPLLTMGCSLSTLDRVECESHESCRDAFGLGSVCVSDGYCSQTGLNPRCETTPEDLFEASADGEDRLVLGHLWRNQSFDVEQRSVQLAIRHANDSQGLEGRLYGLVSCDTEALPGVDELEGEDATQAMAAYLAEDLGLPAIVGATSSPETEAAYTVANASDALLISPSSTSPALTTLDGLTCSQSEPGLLWRTVPPDELQGIAIAQDLDARSVKHVSVVYEEGSYGEGLANAIGNSFQGVQLDLYAFTGESDLGSATTSAANGQAHEVVFITSSVDFVSGFLSAAAAINSYADLDLLLADAAYNQDIYDQLTGTSAESLFPRIRGTRPTINEDSTVLQTFVASYSVAYEGEDATTAGFSAYAYDAGWLAVYGTAWAASNEVGIGGIEMARGLRQISNEDGPTVTLQASSWSQAQALFRDGTDFDVVGASGNLNYDPDSCETSAPIELWFLSPNADGSWDLRTDYIVEE